MQNTYTTQICWNDCCYMLQNLHLALYTIEVNYAKTNDKCMSAAVNTIRSTKKYK